jgi:curved DNA-binding protein CbpA
VLGVARGAGVAQIKAAHRALAKRYHPDADGGDTLRFLQVQEAYRLLSDPLQRREWDTKHSPAPVRADAAAAPRPRAGGERRTKTDGTRARPATGTRNPPPDEGTHIYTWSAAEVPWWEDGGTRQARRPPGTPRPRATAAGAKPPPTKQPPTGQPPGAQPPPADQPFQRSQDFEVYNRSSGAAWSMAARAYFRRADQDLPRRGSFWQQGTQPLTAARARVAAEEHARRRHEPRSPAAQTRVHPIRPAAGVAHDVDGISEAREMARHRARAAQWPALPQRLGFALVAWLPFALSIGGGAVMADCNPVASACPANLEPLPAIAIAVVLALLVALPRAAYVMALATVATGIAVLLAFVGLLLAGIRPPDGPAGLAVSAGLVLVLYVGFAAWVAADGPGLRPWVMERRPRRWSG